ncbi:MAG: hypothetical protein M2R45_00274 [Verrucomicrobia subdivision 3 bacterium]|nr:hypothetical protein [Limisphaerales bacterium]MCS1412966.1 hypothetical protein [Limisphaerales bacterium]
MLDDRPYMKSVSFGPVWSATKVILVANTVLFVLQSILERWSNVPIQKYFYLSTAGISNGYVFQLVTYQFLHGGVLHLLCNLLVIYFFGKELEIVLGRNDFLMLYFTGGVVGGVFQITLAWAFPNIFNATFISGQPVGVVGASACAFGLVAAFALMYPDRVITLLLFFVFPFSLRAQTLLWIALALAVFGILVPTDSIAHGAHLGGICVGVSYVHFVIRNSWRFRMPSFSRLFPQKVRAGGGGGKRWAANDRDRGKKEPSSTDFISREIDPILEKISEQGIHSLTEKERKLLENARSRMGRS